MADPSACRIAVIGGGIAGASAASALASHPERPTVTLLEAEPQLAHHTTGRSAAQLVENYGADPIRALTAASVPFLRQQNGGDEFWDQPVLSPQPLMMIGRADQDELVDSMLAEGQASNPTVTEITVSEAAKMFPPLRTDLTARVILEPESSNIDVAGLHQGFVRHFRSFGGEVALSTRVDAASPSPTGHGWVIETTHGDREVDLVVNAAGAWGDVVATTAGVEPVGLTPMRRTAFMVASRWEDSATWAMIHDAESTFYMKPDGAQFLCSPADETPSEPMDARPMEQDVALAIDRINAATSMDIRSIRSSWAGLRTFADDRSMVIGPDPDQPTFVWCVGQGGTGIQTSFGASQLLADLTLGSGPGPLFDNVDLDLQALTAQRYR